MTGQTITISGPDGDFAGYLATPSAGSGPGVVVIQEIFGVNAGVRKIADDLASAGYVALCPDLFWRIEPGIELSDAIDAELQRAFELFGLYDADAGMKDLSATVSTLRARPECTGKVGAVGYCLGGFLTYRTAAETDVDASVGYYGVNIQENLGRGAQIKNPLLLHVAEADEFVPPEAQEKMKEGLKDYPNVTIETYADMPHAFARPDGTHFDASNAKLANDRTAAFFEKHLQS